MHLRALKMYKNPVISGFWQCSDFLAVFRQANPIIFLCICGLLRRHFYVYKRFFAKKSIISSNSIRKNFRVMHFFQIFKNHFTFSNSF